MKSTLSWLASVKQGNRKNAYESLSLGRAWAKVVASRPSRAGTAPASESVA